MAGAWVKVGDKRFGCRLILSNIRVLAVVVAVCGNSCGYLALFGNPDLIQGDQNQRGSNACKPTEAETVNLSAKEGLRGRV